jgi:tripartite-type tricarboxylate transporter receptor subunit TctC
MDIPRRRFLHLAGATAVIPALSRSATAQDYPTRAVHILVGFPPGGGADLSARLIGQWLSERLGQPFVIENRPGAATNIATEAVVRASADGYTLLLAFTSNAINASLYGKLDFNFIEDTAPVAMIMRTPEVMLVSPSFPAKTVREFIAYAKANPGTLNMASGGKGALGHVTGELFKAMTGVDMVHVPYRGDAAAIVDLLAGRVQVHFSGIASSIEFIKSGKLRALAVTTTMRSQALPDIPTMDEFVTGFESSAWFGVCAPHNTPTQIVDKLNTGINEALVDPKIVGRIAELGGTPLPGSPADCGKLIAEDSEKWAKVVKFANIKPE